MDFLMILKAVLVLAVLAFVLGFAINVVSTKFHVEEDKRLETIKGMLPGANCGACGNPGCSAYAEKIFDGNSDGNECTVIKGDAKQALLDYVKEQNFSNK